MASSALPVIAGVQRPSADVVLSPTRLVIDPQPGSMRAGPHSSAWFAGRALIAGGVLLVAGTGAVTSGAVERVSGFLAGSARPVDSVPLAQPSTPAPTAEVSPTPAPTAVAPSVTPSPDVTPSASPIPTSGVAGAPTYVVQPGDTLRGIADRYGTTVARLQQANGIADENLIEVGQILNIP